MGQRCLLQVWKYFMEDMHRCIMPQDGVDWDTHADEIMNEVSWRRSALEFLPGLMANAPDFSEDAWVLEELADQAHKFDCALLKLSAPYDDEWPDPPHGVPESHTWWWPGALAPDYIVMEFDYEEDDFEEDALEEDDFQDDDSDLV